MPILNAKNICKTIMRNGYDAYVITPSLQLQIHHVQKDHKKEIAIATEMDFDTLAKIYPDLQESPIPEEIGLLQQEKDEHFLFRFYTANTNESTDPHVGITRVTNKFFSDLRVLDQKTYEAVSTTANYLASDRVFADLSCGEVKLTGVPLFTLQQNYALAITALRMSANYDLPIEPNTWAVIVQNSRKIIDFVPAKILMEEWRIVAAESMWKFIKLLQESNILFGLIPELAPLGVMKQNVNRDSLEEETIFAHTIRCMQHYPEEKLHHDWIGLVATLFHQIGKTITAEKFDGHWYFFQYHRVGANIARGVLGRLYFAAEDIEIICSIIRNHIRFQSMMTDAGIHKFMDLPETERIIELNRAIIKATENGNYTNFNHNIKYLQRAEQPLSMSEPLLNGNEIMKYTGLEPGPQIGVLREALLNAQILGEVQNNDDAIAFVKAYHNKLF